MPDFVSNVIESTGLLFLNRTSALACPCGWVEEVNIIILGHILHPIQTSKGG